MWKCKRYPRPISMLGYCYSLNCVHTPTPALDFPGGSGGKQSACNAGDPGSIRGLGRSPGEGDGNPLQYSWVSMVANSKESACNSGDLGSVLRSGRSPGEGNNYPLQCSCLENSVDRRAWWAAVHGVTKNWTWLSDWVCTQGDSFLPSSLGGG